MVPNRIDPHLRNFLYTPLPCLVLCIFYQGITLAARTRGFCIIPPLMFVAEAKAMAEAQMNNIKAAAGDKCVVQ